MSDFFPSPERRVGALELPPDLSADVLNLLIAAAGPATDDELVGEAAAVAAFVAQQGERSMSRRRPQVRAIRVTAAALIGSIVVGGGLAAADVLPAPAQRWVSHALGTVGIRVPSPDSPGSAAEGAVFEPQNEQGHAPTPVDLPARETLTRSWLVTAGQGSGGATSGSTAAGSSASPAAGFEAAKSDVSGSSDQQDPTGPPSSDPATVASKRADHGTSRKTSPGGTATTPSSGDTGSGNSASAGSQAKSYGPGGNPAHGAKPGSAPSSSGATSQASRPEVPVAAHAVVPGQVNKSASNNGSLSLQGPPTGLAAP